MSRVEPKAASETPKLLHIEPRGTVLSGLATVPVAAKRRTFDFSLSQRILCDAVAIVDFLAVLLSAKLVLWLAATNGVLNGNEGAPLLQVAPVVALVCVLAMRTAGLYELRTLVQVSRQASRLLIVWTVLSIVAAVAGFGLYKGPQFLVVAWVSLTPAILISARGGISLIFRTLLDRGPLARRVALIGAAPSLGHGARVINEDRLCRLAGIFELTQDRSDVVSDIVAAVRAGSFDDVVILIPSLEGASFDSLVQALSTLPLRVSLLPAAGLPEIVEVEPGLLHAASVAVSDKPVRGWSIVGKAAVDYAAALLLLILASPVMLIVGLAIRIDSPGPAIFRQHRTGRSGQVFTLYKFRSMYVQEDGPRIKQATENDPRVTRVGRFIRKLSLDELPQIINVLRGEMSLVGPRPHAVAHDHHYGSLVPRYWDRFRVKPGITGWAQVNGHRGETRTLDEMAERVQYDVEYATEYSIWRDIWIIVLTPYTLITRSNKAY